jgi:hypothetical protein
MSARKALAVRGSHAWRGGSAIFDEDDLVSYAGLVPLLEPAEQTRLSRLLDEHVRFGCERVKSGAANATPKLASIIAGMAAGADSIDNLDVIRAGGMKRVFDGVYANSTLGTLLREFTHGYTLQLSAVPHRHLVARAERTRHRTASASVASSTSTPCCARSTATPSRATPTGTRRSPGSPSCAKAFRPSPSPSAPRKRHRYRPGCGYGPDAQAPPKAPRPRSPKRSTPPNRPARSPTTGSGFSTCPHWRTSTSRARCDVVAMLIGEHDDCVSQPLRRPLLPRQGRVCGRRQENCAKNLHTSALVHVVTPLSA